MNLLNEIFEMFLFNKELEKNSKMTNIKIVFLKNFLNFMIDTRYSVDENQKKHYSFAVV